MLALDVLQRIVIHPSQELLDAFDFFRATVLQLGYYLGDLLYCVFPVQFGTPLLLISKHSAYFLRHFANAGYDTGKRDQKAQPYSLKTIAAIMPPSYKQSLVKKNSRISSSGDIQFSPRLAH